MRRLATVAALSRHFCKLDSPASISYLPCASRPRRFTGFTRANIDRIWVDPFNYRATLSEAALLLEASGMRVSVYKHQICTMDRQIWHLVRRSISDWKNEYFPGCESCGVKNQCAGFLQRAALGIASISIH
jgi:hypothetical protein